MDPEDYMDKIDKLAADFSECPDKSTAYQLELLLTKFKMAVGIYMFDQLYAYNRLESEVEKYLNSDEEEDKEKFVDSLKPSLLEDLMQ